MNEEVLENTEPEESDTSSGTARRKWHGLMQGLYLLLAAAAVAGAFYYLPLFRVQSITINGNNYVSTEDICRIAGVYRGQHLMEIEAHESAQRLMKDLRIEQAVVRRDFPNGIMIDVEERRPIAMIACEYGFLDLDRRGVVVNAHRQMEGKNIPLLTGTTLRDCFIGDSVEQPLVDSTLMYLSYIRPDRLADITEVSLHDPEAVVARTVNSVEIVIGDLEPERLEEKAMYTQDFLVELQTTVHPMRKLDVRFAQPVVILRQ